MKTLIIYATKHGATSQIAEDIAKYMDDTILFDINSGNPPSISEYDSVILGSYLMAGMVDKKIKKFAEKNGNELMGKRIGLFLSGLQPEEEAKYFKENFSEELLGVAKAKAFLGGIFDPEKCNFLARTMMKKIAKLDSYASTIDEEKIKKFAEQLMGA